MSMPQVAKAEPPAEIIAVLQRQFDEHHKQAQEGGKRLSLPLNEEGGMFYDAGFPFSHRRLCPLICFVRAQFPARVFPALSRFTIHIDNFELRFAPKNVVGVHRIHHDEIFVPKSRCRPGPWALFCGMHRRNSANRFHRSAKTPEHIDYEQDQQYSSQPYSGSPAVAPTSVPVVSAAAS
jgi:hypothetical protein